ncbi:hypothetical protein [Poriferisphaera sp. WC338]|uniref:hypothetical protein n=1 Tax=Poriferisphaera sp. WC338 TaxID=3425129 RepID=UPI003D81A4DD
MYRKTFIIIASLITPSIFAFALFRHAPNPSQTAGPSPQQQLVSLIAHLRTQGYPTAADEIDAWLPPAPSPNNAQAYNNIFAQLIPYDEQTHGYPNCKSYDLWCEHIEDITSPIPDDHLANIQHYLNDNAPALTALRKLDPSTPSRWFQNYQNDHLSIAKVYVYHRKLAHLLQTDTLLANHQKQHNRAYDNITRTIHIANALQNEPILIAPLVRESLYALAQYMIKEQLHSSPPDKQTSRNLLAHLSTINLHKQFITSLIIERADMLSNLDTNKAIELLTQKAQVYTMFIGDDQDPTEEANSSATADYKSPELFDDTFDQMKVDLANTRRQITRFTNDPTLPEQNKIAFATMITEFIQSQINQPYLDDLPQEKINQLASDESAVAHYLLDAYRSSYDSLKLSQARLDLTRTALTCHLYKLDHGSYPSKLTDLVPSYLPAIPTDLYTSKPILYKHDPSTGSIVVYSTGPDLQDDHGRRFASRQYESFGRKPDEGDTKHIYTDITFSLGPYQRTHFPKSFKKFECNGACDVHNP